MLKRGAFVVLLLTGACDGAEPEGNINPTKEQLVPAAASEKSTAEEGAAPTTGRFNPPVSQVSATEAIQASAATVSSRPGVKQRLHTEKAIRARQSPERAAELAAAMSQLRSAQ